MKKLLVSVLRIIKWIAIALAALVVLFLTVVYTGKAIRRITPKGGINETSYVEVNGQEMWISIYGNDINNPVLLYLHGGPGYSASFADYAILDQLADDYTIVNWDQRSCGRTWLRNQDDDTPITLDLMRSDLDVMTDYILNYLGKDKLTIMGISWGSFYGIDFAYTHPEKVECYIGLSQTVGYYEDSVRYAMSYWVESARYLKSATFLSDEEREIANRIDLDELEQFLAETSVGGEPTVSSQSKDAFFELYKAHMHEVQSYMGDHGLTDPVRDCDINIISSVLFCPYYSLWETYQVYSCYDDSIYDGLSIETHSPGEDNYFLGRTEYQCPIYFFLAEDDLSCDPRMAEIYLESINAPDKGIGYTTGGHECTMYHSEDLVNFIHQTVLGNNSANRISEFQSYLPINPAFLYCFMNNIFLLITP